MNINFEESNLSRCGFTKWGSLLILMAEGKTLGICCIYLSVLFSSKKGTSSAQAGSLPNGVVVWNTAGRFGLKVTRSLSLLGCCGSLGSSFWLDVANYETFPDFLWWFWQFARKCEQISGTQGGYQGWSPSGVLSCGDLGRCTFSDHHNDSLSLGDPLVYTSWFHDSV